MSESVIGEKLAPYVPTNLEAIYIALDLLQITDNLTEDEQKLIVLYDLGCGDARLLVEVRKPS